MLGEHHIGNELEDGSFHNPPTAWLEDHLDEFKQAGYDTLALEVPYDADNWLQKSNAVWGGVGEDFALKYIVTIKKIKEDISEYLKRNGIKADKGTVLFFEKIDNWLAKKREELILHKQITTRKPGQTKKENTRTRWHRLAQKAHAKGFRIVQTDASRKTTNESEKIVFYFLDEIDSLPHQTAGIKAIKHYLQYKRGLILRFRDLSMAKRLKESFEQGQGNVLALYGANHASRHIHRGRTSAFRELKASGGPTITA